jgi:hypothetical protein
MRGIVMALASPALVVGMAGCNPEPRRPGARDGSTGGDARGSIQGGGPDAIGGPVREPSSPPT